MYKRSPRPPRSFSGAKRRSSGRGGNSRNRKKGRDKDIDPARFVNKAVAQDTQEAEAEAPHNTFQSFDISEKLKEAITKKGYQDPTPIQDKTIPHIITGGDVIGLADTGTGKTAAFLVPLIDKVLANKSELVMVVAPTRELAIQIEEELKGFVEGMGIRSVCCVGGMKIGPQIRALKAHSNFIIGTPGRLRDLIDNGHIILSRFTTLVLDEADRMLDMGFVDEMRYLANGMPADRQTLFFSATITPEIERLIAEFLKDPVRISVKGRDTSKNVEQDVIRINKSDNKLDKLIELLQKDDFTKVLVFGRTKHGVEKLSKTLSTRGVKAESIHGDKDHGRRQRALKRFKEDHVQVLVATDVAARGLDIADVSHVINFDIPSTYEDYIHRIGRTGRGNKQGKAFTFLE